jgi:hypothetical protein
MSSPKQSGPNHIRDRDHGVAQQPAPARSRESIAAHVWWIPQITLPGVVAFAVRHRADANDNRRREEERRGHSRVRTTRTQYGENQQSDDRRASLHESSLFSASHAARCTALPGVGFQQVPVALVGECSIPVV